MCSTFSFPNYTKIVASNIRHSTHTKQLVLSQCSFATKGLHKLQFYKVKYNAAMFRPYINERQKKNKQTRPFLPKADHPGGEGKENTLPVKQQVGFQLGPE